MGFDKVYHPTTGDLYAIEVAPNGVISRAAGPVPQRDAEAADWNTQDFLDNQDDGEAREDAKWLTRELDA